MPEIGRSVGTEELGIPFTRCYELIQRGDLPAVRIGERSIRVNRRELEEYLLNNCRVATPTKYGAALMDKKRSWTSPASVTDRLDANTAGQLRLALRPYQAEALDARGVQQ